MTTSEVQPIAWQDGSVRILDQTQLPSREVYFESADYREVCEAIRQLRLRGAPLIGIAAAYALVLAAAESQPPNAGFMPYLEAAAGDIRATRPTAVNLSWALERLLARARGCTSIREARQGLLEEAQAIHAQDIENNKRIGEYGASLLAEGSTVLTHCNTGSLATGGFGTALGIIRTAWQQGKIKRVFATETRPLLQGARLTAWELNRDGIPVSVVVDGAAGQLLRRGQVDAVVVGADRIAANGDTANKIGTYPLAVLAKENRVPFYVAAPTSTLDLFLATGEEIPIEEREEGEVATIAGLAIVAQGAAIENPAFDVTPNRYIDTIISENGVARRPYEESLGRLEVAIHG